MKAAVVTKAGSTPVYADFPDPVAGAGEELINVTASALSHLTKARASGTHYSSSEHFPLVPGVDGVGRTADGRRVYFVLPEPPLGGMAEKTVVAREHCVPLPDNVDDVAAAAIANPGMSSWAALKERAHLVPGETVLINGATGSAGRMAVQIAKHLGAKRVIATGRNGEALQRLRALGADVSIPLTLPPRELNAAFEQEFASGIGVVIDYLWGQSAQALIEAAARAGEGGVPIRFVQVGASSGREITLLADALRSSALELLGSGLKSIPLPGLLRAIHQMMQAAGLYEWKIETETASLSDVERMWNQNNSRSRIVFVV
jgi:NADPH:quinone reductase-like Zn-dependent oxidoreductase